MSDKTEVRILERAALRDGYRIDGPEIAAAGVSRQCIERRVYRMVKIGKLHPAKINHKHVRYFANALDALRCVEALSPARDVTVKVASQAGRMPARPGASVDMSRARVTVVKHSIGRYELPPGERVVGGFASMGIGRYA